MIRKLALFCLFLCGSSFAQTALPQTTLTASVPNATQTYVLVASAAGIKVSSLLYMDRELMSVSAINGKTLTVIRGTQSTQPTTHNSGATVFAGTSDQFFSADPQGACTAAAVLTVPWINVQNGNQWKCIAGVWTLTGGPYFSANTSSLQTYRFFPESYGAVKDGVHNDLAALQATSDAADAAGGGLIDLGAGSYNIGSGQWKVGSANAQHFISAIGQGPNVTKILSVNPSGNAIYLQHEKYVHLEGFALTQTGTPLTGIGIAMGGDGGGGTQTNGTVLQNISVSSFNWCISSSGGAGTSSEITFISLSVSSCTNGFRNADFNGLDYTFIQLQMSFNTIGLNCTTPGCNVFGGSSSFNGDDFVFGGNGQNVIVGYRSEVASATFVTLNAGRLTILDSLVEGMPAGNTHTAVQFNGGHLTIENTQLAGKVFVNGSLSGDGSVTIKNSSIVDGLNTYTLTTQPFGQAPCFEFNSGQNAGARFECINNMQLTVDGSNVVGAIGQWPSGAGYIMSPQWSSQTVAYIAGRSVGGVLTPGGSGAPANTIQPTAHVHHVAAGLIKTIDAAGGLVGLNGNPLPLTCVQLVPDAAFTTDTTGNVGKVSTAVVGQVMTVCYDSVAAKWYPSY